MGLNFNLKRFWPVRFLHLDLSAALGKSQLQLIARRDGRAAAHDSSRRVAHHTVATRQHLLRIEMLYVLVQGKQARILPCQINRHRRIQAARADRQSLTPLCHIRPQAVQALG